ncbi:MAG: hypothetical protein FIA94_01815 [Nitrospirae bacterium]|nr:hypothetical protein [Nitrospirota bacterium]
MPRREDAPKRTGAAIREFCDIDCRFAEFPSSDAVDGSKSCRTFIALYCRKKKGLVHKNLPCRTRQAR